MPVQQRKEAGPLRLDDLFANGLGNGFRAALHVQFLVDILQMADSIPIMR
jgi:hypothetical protein